MNRTLRLPLALALALGSSHALALGLGQAEVKSALYQPLEVEIPVTTSRPGETTDMKVRLASPEAFARVGLDRPPALAANLEFTVERRGGAAPVIRITTPTRVNDPFLSFLLEVDWGDGKLLREVTILLDPPGMQQAQRVAAPPPAAVEPEPAPEPVAPAPVEPAAAVTEPAPPPPEPVAVEPEREPAPAPPPAPAPTPTAGEYGPVASGETLWSIAQRTRPDAGISVNQMMIALQQANPEAFIGDNINRLKRGAVLRIPDSSEVSALSASQAAVLVREQMDAWRGEARPQPQPAEPEPEAVAARPQAPRREDARLELVAARSEDAGPESARSGGDTGSEAGSELRAELARAQEEVAAREQEIDELQSRVAELEEIQTDNQRLLAMKDSEMAALQRRLAELEAERAAAAAAGPDAGAVEPEAAAVEPEPQADPQGLEAEDGTEAAAEEAPVDAGPVADATEPPAEVEVDAESAAAEVEPVATPPAPTQAPTDRALPWYRNLWFLVGAGLVALGLVALLLLRRRSGSEVRRPREYGGGSLADSFGGPATGAAAAAVAEDDAEEPGAEREAELVDALAEHPEDLHRHLELARFYYEEGDADAFEGVAEAMYAQVDDPDALEWRQVVAMGRELLPDHPLFAEAAPAEPEPLPEDADYAPEPEPGPEAEFGESYGAEPAAVDSATTGRFEIDWETAAPAATPEPEPAAHSAEPEPEFEPEPASDAGATQRFRIEDLEPGGAPEVEAEAPEPQRDEAAAGEYGFDGGEDAAATKLELARAYLDMGDVEGARGMLEEVVNEGNAGQRDEARRLLDEIR